MPYTGSGGCSGQACALLFVPLINGGFQNMNASKPSLTQEEGVWVIRLENSAGKVQEFRCATEMQAKQLAAVLMPTDGAAKR